MRGRVAVVEDEDLVLSLLVTILEDRGYEVLPFSTKAAALEGLRATPPDLLIVDVRLPDGCGLDLVGTVRSAAGRKVPAIVLSGLREERDFVRGFAAGAVDYLGKPFNRDELLARCAVHLARTASFEAPNDQEPELPQSNGLAFGRYEIEDEIGRGGYGKVYRARDAARGNEIVALKVLSPLSGEQQDTRVRFIRETYSLASIRDPHVVAVHDVGSQQGRLYYAMEYVEGESLGTVVRRDGLLDEASARVVAHGLLEACAALEVAKILHRDIKPENVMFRGGKLEEPLLIDFGLAKRQADRGITEADMIVGTLSYLAPEVIRGRESDGRSDLFSLGLTLRFALTGDEVFPDLRGMDVLTAIMRGPIPPPATPLSPGFAAWLAKLCECDVDKRFASADEARLALEALEPAPAAHRGPSGTVSIFRP